jgi:hypothetical protein
MVPNPGEICHYGGGSFIDRRTTAALLIQWNKKKLPLLLERGQLLSILYET